jgi:hypothetical protein
MEMVLEGDRCIVPLLTLCNDINLLNALNKFHLGGLFALCNQSDCNGHYTPGNSLDICILLDIIEPNLKSYESYDCIYQENQFNQFYNYLYKVFEHSHTNKCIIRIW